MFTVGTTISHHLFPHQPAFRLCGFTFGDVRKYPIVEYIFIMIVNSGTEYTREHTQHILSLFLGGASSL